MIEDENNTFDNNVERTQNEHESFEEPLKVKMYCFVPYNICDKQKGIQLTHAALRYARAFSADNPEVWDFVDNHETIVMLDGGTMNDQRDFDGIPEGSMNQIADQLVEADINFSYFTEPDLNNGLSAVCFLADERVFNRKDYPDFVDYYISKHVASIEHADTCKLKGFMMMKEEHPNVYKEWVRLLGGVKNVFLREITRDKKTA